jgi:hypothetical protein
MSRRVMAVIVTALVGSMLASAPAAAGQASVDRIEDFGTVLAVRFGDDFPIASLMRADCEWLIRVERPDGSARETMHCTLSDEPVMVPALQGSPPDRAFLFGGGACLWTSDYWWAVIDAPVYAESFSYVVTPSGSVQVSSTYPAEPLSCD